MKTSNKVKGRPPAIGLVTVSGGVAETYAPKHVCVMVVDIDNIKAGDGKTALPAGVGFEQLVELAWVQDCVEFVPAEEFFKSC